MSLSRRYRCAAIVGMGSLALVLTGGPAFAGGVLGEPDAALALQRALEQTTQDVLAPAQQALEPVTGPLTAPSAPGGQPAPAKPAPLLPKPAPAKPGPAAPGPVEAVTGVVGALVTVVLDQLDAKPAPQPAPAPGVEGPANGQDRAGGPVSGPAAPVVTPTPRLSSAVVAANPATDAGSAGQGGAALTGLGEFARDMSGIRAADARLLDSLTAELSPTLAMSDLLPQTANPQEFLPVGRSQGGPAGLPVLLVAAAAAAVAISAAGNGKVVWHRR